MGTLSIWHWVIVALVILLLFGKGRISEMMGDLGKGITSFKKGLSEEEASARDSEQKILADRKEARADAATGPVEPTQAAPVSAGDSTKT